MKKLALICLVLAGTNSFSQSFLDKFHFGLKAGSNYSDFTNADFDTEGLVGFHAGAIVNFEINEKFSIQEEFLFSTQGSKIKDGIFQGQKIELSYVSVPVLFKYTSPIGIYAEAGPQIGILVSEDVKGIDSADKFAEKIDGGFTAGIGYQFRNGFGIGARYYFGLTDVSKSKTATVKTDFQNNSAQASIFYIF
ncbi:MAG: porin family protein [Flavobacterium sp.]